MSYYIENNKGEWLMRLDNHEGKMFTRDPIRAWVFKKKEQSQEEIIKRWGRVREAKLWFNIDLKLGPATTADPIIGWIEKDCPGYSLKVKEYDFQALEQSRLYIDKISMTYHVVEDTILV